MTDSQLGALIATLATFLSGLLAMLKWAASRIVKALDDNTAGTKADTEAKIALARELGVFSTKLDQIAHFVEHHTPVEGVPITPPTPPIQEPPRRPTGQLRQATPPHGVYSIVPDKKR